jgi:hypothetical protein
MIRKAPSLSHLVFYGVFIAGCATLASAAVKETVLYSFQGGSDGDGPVGSIVIDKDGNIFGATTYTLSCITLFQCGAVYELSPPAEPGGAWTETTLHEFQGYDHGDAGAPGGGLIQDAEGNLYGTTSYGGSGPCLLLGDAVGCGAVYEMVRPTEPGGAWEEKVLYSFQGGQDGQFPIGDLVFDKQGNLYGATWFGGGKGDTCNSLYPYCGTIFMLSPVRTSANGPWTEKVLCSFQGEPNDGGQPYGGLVFDSAGNIYGATWVGGSGGNFCQNGCGTVYKLTRPQQKGGEWTETMLHSFSNYPKDGAGPNGNLVISSGALLGTTQAGGKYESGTVFALIPQEDGSWKETFLHVFTGGADGTFPTSLLTGPDHRLYGVVGGGPTHKGLIYRMSPPVLRGGTWVFDSLYIFVGPPDGYDPAALRFGNKKAIFGTTTIGGDKECAQGGCGTIFQLTP